MPLCPPLLFVYSYKYHYPSLLPSTFFNSSQLISHPPRLIILSFPLPSTLLLNPPLLSPFSSTLLFSLISPTLSFRITAAECVLMKPLKHLHWTRNARWYAPPSSHFLLPPSYPHLNLPPPHVLSTSSSYLPLYIPLHSLSLLYFL
jgi:hypothetical protein